MLLANINGNRLEDFELPESRFLFPPGLLGASSWGMAKKGWNPSNEGSWGGWGATDLVVFRICTPFDSAFILKYHKEIICTKEHV